MKSQQAKWAALAGLLVDDRGYCTSPDGNLPWLTKQTKAEFMAADGHKLAAGRRATIAALHSSSALAVNVFDY